jgi:hypothetical protein
VLWNFVSCLWSDQSQFTELFMVFNLWIGPSFIFEPCTKFFGSHFPVTTLRLDLFSGTYFNKLLLLTEKSLIQRCTRLANYLLENRTEPASKMSCCFKIIIWFTKPPPPPKKKKTQAVNFNHALIFFWICLLNMGPRDCPETPVGN